MPQYQILRMDKEGTPPVFYNGKPYISNNPKDAQEYCKVWSEHYHEKACVKVIADDSWRKRENDRMMKADYRPVPWQGSSWWQDGYAIWKDHFPHASLEKPGFLAYTKSEEDGAKDKQTIVRPGSYLTKYFEIHLHNHGVSQRGLVDQFMTLYGPTDVKFATEEADIVKAYAKGPKTCMNDRAYHGANPISVYAAGDLAIAYLGDLNGKVSARALCWPERKTYSRVYGDVARLTQGLTRLGFVWGAPIGAKLKRIPYQLTEYKNGRIPARCFIAPYIDKKNNQGGGHLGVIDMKDHLVICEDDKPGSHHCGMADGTTGTYTPREDEHPHYTCDHCGGKTTDIGPVYIEGPDEDGDHEEAHQWCKTCRDARAWACRYSGNLYAKGVKYVDVGGQYWQPYYADMYARTCQGNGKLYASDDMYNIYMPDGVKRYSTYYIQNSVGRVFTSQITERYYPISQQVSIYFGHHTQIAAKAELKHHAFQCDGCGNHWSLQFREQPKDTDKLLCPTCAGVEIDTGKKQKQGSIFNPPVGYAGLGQQAINADQWGAFDVPAEPIQWVPIQQRRR